MASPAEVRGSRLAPGRVAGLLLRVVLLAIFVSVPAWLVLRHFATLEPWLYPLHRLQAPVRTVAQGLAVGPYPDHARLVQLRDEGYRLVVSVLRPDLVYERSLIARERQQAAQLGLDFFDFPMRSEEPATSPRNAHALQAIGQLLASRPGQAAYVHCYLGKHRTQYVADWLARGTAQTPR